MGLKVIVPRENRAASKGSTLHNFIYITICIMFSFPDWEQVNGCQTFGTGGRRLVRASVFVVMEPCWILIVVAIARIYTCGKTAPPPPHVCVCAKECMDNLARSEGGLRRARMLTSCSGHVRCYHRGSWVKSTKKLSVLILQLSVETLS